MRTSISSWRLLVRCDRFVVFSKHWWTYEFILDFWGMEIPKALESDSLPLGLIHSSVELESWIRVVKYLTLHSYRPPSLGYSSSNPWIQVSFLICMPIQNHNFLQYSVVFAAIWTIIYSELLRSSFKRQNRFGIVAVWFDLKCVSSEFQTHREIYLS